MACPVCGRKDDLLKEILRGYSSYMDERRKPMNKFFLWLLNPPTDGPKSTLVLRLMAGGVFFWEGLLKFV
jgi:hypothetical protein